MLLQCTAAIPSQIHHFPSNLICTQSLYSAIVKPAEKESRSSYPCGSLFTDWCSITANKSRPMPCYQHCSCCHAFFAVHIRGDGFTFPLILRAYGIGISIFSKIVHGHARFGELNLCFFPNWIELFLMLWMELFDGIGLVKLELLLSMNSKLV